MHKAYGSVTDNVDFLPHLLNNYSVCNARHIPLDAEPVSFAGIVATPRQRTRWINLRFFPLSVPPLEGYSNYLRLQRVLQDTSPPTTLINKYLRSLAIVERNDPLNSSLGFFFLSTVDLKSLTVI